MAYDVTLGDQQFPVDNPNVLFGLIDNLAKMQQNQQVKLKQDADRNKLLESLASYDINPMGGGQASSFEELGSRYQGTTGEYDEGGHPIPKFSGGGKPQVRNLKQLVEVIQGLKGLPQEYSGAIISRLTGIADPSQAQTEAVTKLRASLLEKDKTANLEQKKAQATATDEYRKQQIDLRKEALNNQRIQRINVLSNALEKTTHPLLKQKLAEMYMNELTAMASGEGAAPTLNIKWSKK